MTILSNNIRRMRKLYGFTQETLGHQCGVSGAAVSQWEAKHNPTVPEVDNLLTMAGLFKVTIEQLVYSTSQNETPALSNFINNATLEKVFLLLSENPLIDKALSQANIKRKTYMFGLLYTLCEDMDISELAATTGLMELIGLQTRDTVKNEPTKKITAHVSKKQH